MGKKKAKSPSERYQEWWINRNPAEMRLHELACDFEERHFDDLRLITPSISKQLLCYQVQLDDGSWIDTEDEFPVTIDEWIFKLRRNGTVLGTCYSNRKTIVIAPGLDDIQHPAAVLHEMIHAYESQLSAPFREWLVLYLHARMLKRISPRKLKRYVNASTHSLVHNCAHGTLFLLKSLDLDLRFGWKPGTVFGYGRQQFFGKE